MSNSVEMHRETRLKAGKISCPDYLTFHSGVEQRSQEWTCNKCNKTLHSNKSLAIKLHLKKCNPGLLNNQVEDNDNSNLPLVCSLCNAIFDNCHQLDMHASTAHKNVSSFRCSVCFDYVSKAASLRSHYALKHRMLVSLPKCLYLDIFIYCRSCGHGFATENELKIHMEDSLCSSIILMEKLPDNWESLPLAELEETCEAVEEEYDLAFPGRKLIYAAFPKLLDKDYRILSSARSDITCDANSETDIPEATGRSVTNKRKRVASKKYTDPDFYDFASNSEAEAEIEKESPGVKRRKQLDLDRSNEFNFDSVLRPSNMHQIIFPKTFPNTTKSGTTRTRRKKGNIFTAEEAFFESGKQFRCRLCNMFIDQWDDCLNHFTELHANKVAKSKAENELLIPSSSGLNAQNTLLTLDSKVANKRGTNYLRKLSQVSFACPICMEDLRTLKLRDQHLQSAHPNSKVFGCLECSQSFTTYLELRLHGRQIHPSTLIYNTSYKLMIAPQWRKKSTSLRIRSSISGHRPVSAAVKPFQCSNCGMQFSSTVKLEQHYKDLHRASVSRSVAENNIYDEDLDDLDAYTHVNRKCDNCDFVADTLEHLEQHWVKDHKDLCMYSCAACDTCYPNFVRLRQHQKIKHMMFIAWRLPPRPLMDKVNECGTIVPNSGSTLACPVPKRDMAKAAFNQLKQVDPDAAAAIPIESVLKNVDMDNLVVFCEFCNEPCANKIELGKHIQTHTSKRSRFACQRCGQIFEGMYGKMDLMDHLKIDHLGKPRYRCPHCEAAFKFMSLLKNHMAKANCHSGACKTYRILITFCCPDCDKIFSGEGCGERFSRHKSSGCVGPVTRALPEGAKVPPAPTAVITGVVNTDLDQTPTPITRMDTYSPERSKMMQVNLPGVKDPVNVLLQLEPTRPDSPVLLHSSKDILAAS